MSEPLRAIEGERTEVRAPRFNLINPADWEGIPVPDREWIVPDFIPARTVTLLTGEGAAGKSTLALQLGVARALDREWLSVIPKPGRTLILSAEDDSDELHRRINAIRVFYDATFASLSDLRLLDLVGEDSVLGSFGRDGIIRSTPLFNLVMQEIGDFEPDLVIIDALADAFAGDENNRGQARQFIGLLKRPARQFQCAFLCLAHPSLTGLSSGTGSSGSTAWANSVRSRIFFEKARATDGSEPDPDMRTLTVNKANYTSAGTMLTLKWELGVYRVQTGPGSLDRMALENRADDAFLDLLRLHSAQGQNVSANRGTTYAPSIFAGHPQANGIGKAHLALAMQRHFTAGRIKTETFGPPSRQRSKLVLAGAE